LKAILVSEDKEIWEQMQRMLQALYSSELEVICALTQDDAIKFSAAEGPFAYMIIDCDMKHSDPTETAYCIMEVSGDSPCIFIGSEAMIADRITQELYQKHEHNDSIIKPIDRSDVKMKCDVIMEGARKKEIEDSIEEIDLENFIPMKLKSFYLYNTFPYDMYMEITSTKFMKAIEANQPYTISTLHKYAKRGLKYLHIKKDDQLRYLEDETQKCIKAMKKFGPAHKDIFLVLLRAVNVFHQYLIAVGVCDSVLRLADATTDMIIQTAQKRHSFHNIVEKYPIIYEGIASKSLLTGLISQIMAENMAWQAVATKKRLALASMLMDFTLPDEKLCKVTSLNDPILKEFSEDQLAEYIQHPLKVAEVATQFTQYPDVDYILEMHHELPNRKGFPNAPSQTKLTALCSVFNISQHIAAEIDGMALSNETISKIMKAMGRDYGTGNFKEPLKVAKKIIKINE
jgi:hypothetical protein